MQQYWAKHEGKRRWGIRVALDAAEELYRSDAGAIFIWADRAEIEQGCLVFRSDEGELQAALAPGQWLVVFEAKADIDEAPGVETR